MVPKTGLQMKYSHPFSYCNRSLKKDISGINAFIVGEKVG
jgi:hypothetical protein